MFEIRREKNEIAITVKLEKRTLARHPKKYVYWRDGLNEIKQQFPDLKISENPDNKQTASTVKAPHEVTWRFKIIEKEEQTSKPLNKKIKKTKNISEPVEDLTSDEERVTIEETTEKVQEPTE